MLVKKNVLKDILHFLLYLLIISIIVFICLCIYHSFNGYQITSIVNNDYYNNEVIISILNDVEVEFYFDNNSTIHYYYIDHGILKFDEKEFVILDNGLFDEENNIFYFKI